MFKNIGITSVRVCVCICVCLCVCVCMLCVCMCACVSSNSTYEERIQTSSNLQTRCSEFLFRKQAGIVLSNLRHFYNMKFGSSCLCLRIFVFWIRLSFIAW
uniref:Secreted protein n=1 Tax=Sipha flava TaxID=143950 RepID=A0A2S2Q4U8_9HEMI